MQPIRQINPWFNTFDRQAIANGNGPNGIDLNGGTNRSGSPAAANRSSLSALSGSNGVNAPVVPAAPRPFGNADLVGPGSVLPTVEDAGTAARPFNLTPPSSAPLPTTTIAPTAPTPATPCSASASGRASFKNPLDMWKSPSPPSKRQKTEKTTTPAKGSSSRAGDVRATPISGAGFRRSNSDAAARDRPVQWTPQTVSLSQPMPSTTPKNNDINGASSGSILPDLRTGKKPLGFIETVENNRVVYLLDSDNEDDVAPGPASAPALRPVPAPVPASAPTAAAIPSAATVSALATASTPVTASTSAVQTPTTQAPVFPKLSKIEESAARLKPRQRLIPPGPWPLRYEATQVSTSTDGAILGRSPPATAATANAVPVNMAPANGAPARVPPVDVAPAHRPQAPVDPPPQNDLVPVGIHHQHYIPSTPQHWRQQQQQKQQQPQTPMNQANGGIQSPWMAAGPLNANHGPSFTAASQSSSHAGASATPIDIRRAQAVRSAPLPTAVSASQPSPAGVAASVPPVSAVRHVPPSVPIAPAMPATPVACAPPSAGSATRTPAAPVNTSLMIISADASPVIHHNEANEVTHPIGEKMAITVVTDVTPNRNRMKLDVQKAPKAGKQTYIRYANLSRRPYLCSAHRTFVSQNYSSLPSWLGRDRPQRQQVAQPPKTAKFASTAPSTIIHVDFLPEEIQPVLAAVRLVQATTASAKASKKAVGKKHLTPERELKHLLRRQAPEFLQLVANNVSFDSLPGRDKNDVLAFLTDATKGTININSTAKPTSATSTLSRPKSLTLRRHDRATYTTHQQQAVRAANLNTHLFMREVAGLRFVPGRGRQLLNFTNAARTLREDGLRLRNEWTNLAGDVTTISWASEEAFICGTTTHMDDRNHQYNRQGNLALASVRKGTMQAYSDHRVARSRVAPQGRTESYDDPWLYTSVVSSDYDATHDFAFTSGFDNTVQMWRVSKDGGSMTHQNTWKHEGKVNFVVASSCPVCLVATAADVPVNAVRIYRLPTLQERLHGQRISYKTLSCERLLDLEGKPILTDKWAYFPAAVRWGISEATRHLLLVGYSPRGLGVTAEDDDIPEERRNSGELCLWDGLTGDKWRLLGGTSQNVFEVAWHPTQACFIAATAPTLHSATIEEHVRTQIRIFRRSVNAEYGGRAYNEVQTLDCYADDINELALRPNSLMFMYVAAGCTNGTTYVWDSSQGDDPIHALAHGACIEEQSGETISVEDTGVKFVAWGATADRLYTGSSDGLVKAWNIRTHGASDLVPYVKNVLQCPAPVSFGAFSPSKARLAVGDASGRVFLLSVEDGMENDDEDGPFISEDEAGSGDDANDATNINKGMAPARPGLLRRSRLAFKHHPPEVIRHATPPPPTPTVPPGGTGVVVDNAVHSRNGNKDDDEDSGLVRARAFLTSGQITVHRDPTIGAVKGPNYAETQLFCRDFHLDGLPERPLLAQYDRHQQENRPRASSSPSRQRALRRVLPDVGPSVSFASATSLSNSSVLGTPDPQQSLQRQNAIRRVQALHRENLARDFDVSSLAPETRLALNLADRAALLHLDDDYGFVYEELPGEES